MCFPQEFKGTGFNLPQFGGAFWFDTDEIAVYVSLSFSMIWLSSSKLVAEYDAVARLYSSL